MEAEVMVWFLEGYEDDQNQRTSVSGHSARPASRSAYEDCVEPLRSSDTHLLDGIRASTNVQNVIGHQNNGSCATPTFASVVGSSLSRSNTPDPQLAARVPSPRLPPVGVKMSNGDKKSNASSSLDRSSSTLVNSDDLMSALSGMKISNASEIDENVHSSFKNKTDDHQNFLFDLQSGLNNVKQHPFLQNSDTEHLNVSSVHQSSRTSFPGLVRSSSSLGDFNSVPLSSIQHAEMTKTLSSNNSYPKGHSATIIGCSGGSPVCYPGSSNGSNASFTTYGLNGYAVNSLPSMMSNQAGMSNLPPLLGSATVPLGLGSLKAYLGALLQPQKQFGVPLLGKSGYYGNSSFGLGVSYPDGGGSIHEGFASSLLEEFKNNKTKCYELSDIEGHVVEFSADQYGSRFIQQKLESATPEEKAMVFSEIMPHAFSLMTDVFGNYVVQKFFEHGSSVQRRELADQLTGHVLALSLQMYGCRVIQKAIEVVDLDQQTKMVQELDGHVMRCVRDQNGNHVIQKCIECIPQDAIQFIVSTFYDQVVTLSTHPYGCRVIQRVLEHCHDPKTQQIMMDEILQSVCMLAQDQYGNYVVQHVLEHGKPHERSAIIEKLAGQIVPMSQQKFASNVVEKCLTFGGPEERQLLVNEMLGATDENEPLQAMMKDQFANYVVQKVLETCDDQQRELILSRIKVHLNALKKYTYGKHIVARVEKLVAAGERRIGVQPSYA
ncbi:hypothetical protein HPP92_012603 [Vanilla planifolia]|uniref:PUM-HD domain-containing protein n=1 Tax=Vanilla planifolia TaxID=51239 RepID=A0A835QXU0_VANPL|nr:hypothetical protein HPP92_012603 [Vanilla planifolia]